MINNNKFLLIIAAMMLSSAAFAQGNLHYEGNSVTLIEPGANVSTTPIIADESICGERFTETVVLDQFPANRRNLKYVDAFQAQALAQLAREHDADFIITTQVNVTTQDGCFAVTVTGYPARYENFRTPTKEDMNLLWKAKSPGYGPGYGYGYGSGDPYTSTGYNQYIGLLEIPHFDIQPGFQQMLDLALVATDDTALELTYTAGYRFTKSFYLGGGTGIAYSWWNEDVYIPVYVNPMFYLSTRRVAPTIGMRLGFYTSIANQLNGNPVTALVDLRPGVRVRTNSGKDVNVSLTIGSRPCLYNVNGVKNMDGSYVEGGLCVGFSF